jgi:hypothetical protein
VAPTALYLLGQPVPAEMDGKVLTAIFSPSYLASNPIRSPAAGAMSQLPSAQAGLATEPLTADEEKEIRAHLRGLGYL